MRVKRMVLDELATIRMPAKKFLTPEEAAAYLSFDVKHLAKLRRLGTGPAFVRKGSRVIRYSVSALDSWLTSDEGEA
jgi:hypothetical protein